MVKSFSTKYMANDDFCEPLDVLIPKIPFACFAEFWVWVTSGAQGSVSVGFWGGGGRQLSPFFWGGGFSPEGCIDPPPPRPKPTPKGGGPPPLYRPQNDCTEQWVLWEILF